MYDKLIDVLRWFARMCGFPAINDSEELQDWLLEFFAMADSLTALIPGKWDDNLVRLGKKVVGDDDAWAAIHEWLMAEFSGLPKSGGPPVTVATSVAEGLGVDYKDVLEFLEWLIKVLRIFVG